MGHWGIRELNDRKLPLDGRTVPELLWVEARKHWGMFRSRSGGAGGMPIAGEVLKTLFGFQLQPPPATHCIVCNLCAFLLEEKGKDKNSAGGEHTGLF